MANDVILFPTVPKDLSTIVKPEELVDIVEMTPLTLQDRRIYNLLVGNAWNDILTKGQHTIGRKQLTAHVNSNNQDISASLRRLMSSIVQIKIRGNKNGEQSLRQIALLGSNEIEAQGEVTYSFPPDLVKIIKNTQVFARLHTKVMFELSSKYSLSLYEFLQKRKNLTYVNSEKLTLEEARGLLGVPKNTLASFGHFNDKALKPATKEVSYLTDYDIEAHPIRTGKKVTHIQFTWKRKSDIGAQISAVEELERSKVGRQSRIDKNSANLELELPPITRTRHVPIETLMAGKKIAIAAGTGWDIHGIQAEFFDYIAKVGEPDDLDAAFIGFVKKKVVKHPR